MANEWDPDTGFDVWADDRARQILIATAQAPQSVADLTESCDGSESSIYRRVAVLTDIGLLTEHANLDSNGAHYATYEAAFDRFRVRIADGSIRIEGLEDAAGSPDRVIDVIDQ